MIKKCSWCKKTLGFVEPLHDDSETSTICPTCMARVAPGSGPEVNGDVFAKMVIGFVLLLVFFGFAQWCAMKAVEKVNAEYQAQGVVVR